MVWLKCSLQQHDSSTTASAGLQVLTQAHDDLMLSTPQQTLPHMLDEAAAVLLDAAGLFRVLRLVLTAQLVRLAVTVEDDAAVACITKATLLAVGASSSLLPLQTSSYSRPAVSSRA